MSSAVALPTHARARGGTLDIRSTDESERLVEAIVSVFGNVDAYGTRMVRGCFKNTLARWSASGFRIPFVWSHQHADPFAFIGDVLEAEELDTGLRVLAHVNDDTEYARQVYNVLQARRVKEFSFAFEILEWEQAIDENGQVEYAGWWDVWNILELDLLEVGPCFRGANDQTQLIDVRQKAHQEQRDAALRRIWGFRAPRQIRDAIATHSTDTDEGAWDGPANEARLDNDAGADVYRAAYAWRDPDGDPDTKSSYRFIHHFVGQDGTPGAASTVACSAGIGVLNGAQGGTDIPDEERQGVYDHLARHLLDADIEPPELDSQEDGVDSAKVAAAIVQAFDDAQASVREQFAARVDEALGKLLADHSDDPDDAEGEPAEEAADDGDDDEPDEPEEEESRATKLTLAQAHALLRSGPQ